MLLFASALVAGLAALSWSSDRFVTSASALARRLGVSHLIIGVTIVSLGTSAPEILVAVHAALEGAPELGLGNALGSNIANIGLVLGVTLLLGPLQLSRTVRKRENNWVLLTALVTGALLYNLHLDRLESVALLTGLVCFLVWIYRQNSTEGIPEFQPPIPGELSLKAASVQFIVSLVILIASARLLVWGAIGIAQTLGIHESVIGATLVALGTSLPELAAAIASVRKHTSDIALGNVLGSNIFNLLTVMAMPALIRPFDLSPAVFSRDYRFMMGMTALLFVIIFIQGRRHRPINRFWGGVFVLLYCAYGLINYRAVTA